MGYENSGRRPQSTALTVLRGNPSRKKLNENEPCPPAGEIQEPEGLSAGAAKVWGELAPICQVMGTLTLADLRPFAMLCELQAILLHAAALKDEPGQLMAAIKLERQYAALIRPYYALFGLEPVSRSRISVRKPAEAPVSKWAGVLK